MAGESLQQYKQKQQQVFWTNAGMPSNNFNRNHEATKKPYNRSGSNGYPSLIFSNIPNMNWQGKTYKTYDSILANNSIPKNSGKKDTLTTISNIFGVATSVAALAVTGKQVYDLFKSNKGDGTFSKKETKEIAKKTEDATDTAAALDACIETAKGLDENSSQSKIRTAVNNLTHVEEQAKRQRKEALCNVTSAERSLKLINDKKLDVENEKNGLLANKSSLSDQIKDSENADTSDMTDVQKSAHKAKISELKQQLKEVEKKIENSDKKLEQFDKDIAVQQEIIKNNNETAKNLATKAADAKSEITRLNNLVKP